MPTISLIDFFLAGCEIRPYKEKSQSLISTTEKPAHFLTKNTEPLLFFGLSLIFFDWKLLTIIIIKLVDQK